MKAVYIDEHGDIEKLNYGELPDPIPRGNEIVLKVRACALNRADLWVRKGLPFWGPRRFPHILGGDVAGEVVTVGPFVRSAMVGTQAVLNPGIGCDHCESCRAGKDNFCSQYQVLGVDLQGGYADLVKVPESNLVPFKGTDWEIAACVPGAYITAWAMLFEKAQLQPGEWALVHAAGSGVGSAAIQLALLAGANVITTAGSDQKLEKASGLGVRYLINYNKQDFLHEVRRITKKRGVDVVIEHMGRGIWERSLLCLTSGGRMVTCGVTSGYQVKTNVRHVFCRELRIYGNKLGSKASLFKIMRLLQERKIQPVVDRVLPLKDARQAHQVLEERKNFGKVVLVP